MNDIVLRMLMSRSFIEVNLLNLIVFFIIDLFSNKLPYPFFFLNKKNCKLNLMYNI